ncbi:MAG TPA: PqiC family protein [Candidatus Methylomirabilis sp.]|nr:PqiC family protein [Candidatus Methylomirabilis sp.]
MDVRAGRRVALAVAVAALGIGCSVSDPTRYYVLTSAPGAAGGAGSPGSGAAVGVGPVSIPEYLDRVQMVTRDGGGRVQIWPYQVWAEPLDQGIMRVLMEDLAAGIPTDRVVAFPWSAAMQQILQYQVQVSVLRFDGQTGGAVALETRWRLVGKGGQEIAFRRSTVTEAAGGAGYEPLAAAMSRAVGSLAREIASEIRAQPGGAASR